MSDNLYGASTATQPGLGDQMDPLGTANQHAFGQPAPGAEPAAGFGAAPVAATIGAAPAASVKIGKVKTKKPLSTGKKVLYGAGGILFAFFGLIIVLDPGPQHINPSPTPPATAPAAPAQMGAPGASENAATLMGGSPAPEPMNVAAGAQPADLEAPAAPAPAPAPAAVAAASPVAQTVEPKPVVTPSEKLVMVKEKAPAGTASSDELASRVATLEKRLARYEREEARQRAQAAKAAAQTRIAQAQARGAAPAPAPATAALPTAVYRPVSASSAVEMRRPAILSNDTVRVIGVSTRHGVTTALVDFGGVKHRVATGEAIAGLGTVGSVAVDAAGNPVVEINGVRYQ